MLLRNTLYENDLNLAIVLNELQVRVTNQLITFQLKTKLWKWMWSGYWKNHFYSTCSLIIMLSLHQNDYAILPPKRNLAQRWQYYNCMSSDFALNMSRFNVGKHMRLIFSLKWKTSYTTLTQYQLYHISKFNHSANEIILQVHFQTHFTNSCTENFLCEIDLRRVPKNRINDKSTLVQVIAWC